ncbi:MAG: glycoside hydrolase family 125 protein [Bacteroidota bacterium]|nr:glycoside hydrolase family 125 protein [Bacteroidota bacterium]
MNNRREFLQTSGILTTGLLLKQSGAFAFNKDFVSKRPPVADRKFTSKAVEETISKTKKQIADPELAWLFENCFPNTLDTTVDFEMMDGKPDTYVITGDIDAMWLRDSTAQVWPYLSSVKNDEHLQQLVEGVINRQVKCIHLDPYANAFYKDENKISEWKSDLTAMKPGIHERKWEIDSLCYPVRLAHQYWKLTGNTGVFGKDWEGSIGLMVKTFKEQQRKNGRGPYTFQRSTAWATDGIPLAGYGYPVKPVGLICSMFRPSDDATIFPFLIPSNFFAVVSLRQAAEMVNAIHQNKSLANECNALAYEVENALYKYAIISTSQSGKIYAYEVNGFGSYNLMDDANVPSLLSLPYLNAVKESDPVYLNTRKFVLSPNNPFFFKGTAGEGIGGPHAGMDMIWPLSIIMRGLTSNDEMEVKKCLSMLKNSNAGTGFMHESFNKNDASNFTRKWFAWANTLFGELILHTSDKYPAVLKSRFS